MMNQYKLPKTQILKVFLLVAVFSISVSKAYSQAQCASPAALTIGANDQTCNSLNFNTLGPDFDDNTPTAITTVTNTCGVNATYNANWYSFTGDGTMIRFKIFGQDQVSRILVFENQTCAATMTALQCSSFPDDGLPHTVDINTINGATYKIAVTRDGSATMVGSVCAYKTNGLPYSYLCDVTPVNITVNAKDLDCFTNYNSVSISHLNGYATPPSTCGSSALDEWWLGTFTATSTSTEVFLWGKDKTSAAMEVLEGPCSGSMTSVVCVSNTGDKAQPNWGQFTSVIGKQYYVIIKYSSTGNTGRVCVYNSTVETNKPICTAGMSFEDGSGTGWDGKYGGWRLAWTPACNQFTWDVPNTPANFNNNRFRITTGTARDAKIQMVSQVAPGGGTYSFRMGVPSGTAGDIGQPEGYSFFVPGDYKMRNHAAAEKMEYCFTVDPSNAGFGYKYSCLMDNPMHNAVQQPYFEVFLYEQATGTKIQCGEYQHWPGDGKSPFHYVGNLTDVNSNSGPCFTPWNDVITDLSGHVGSVICAIFRQKDCSGNYTVPNNPPWDSAEAGSHGVYTYFDTYCIPMNIEYPEFCAGAASIQICAPQGYQSYSWAPGQPGIQPPLNTRCVTILNPVGGTNYTVTMLSFSGCPVARSIVITGIPVTKTTDTTVCQFPTPSVRLYVDIINPITPPYTYTWSCGGTESSVTVNPTANATYTVTITNGDACTSIETLKVNLISCAPVVVVNNVSNCIGSCSVLTAIGTGGVPPYTYLWSPGGGTASTISVCPTTTTTYYVTITDNVSVTNSSSAVVTVNTLPSITAQSVVICNGQTTSVCANGGVTYTWSTGPNTTCLTVSPGAFTTYSVTGTDANQCTNVATASVTVNPNPTITAANKTICNGQTTTVCASGGISYTWNTPANTTCVTVNPSVTTPYYVTGADANGCTNVASATVNVNPLPNITASATPVCIGNQGVVCANGGLTYTWNTGPNTTCISVTPTISTNYIVSGTDGNGCINSATVTLTINPLPTITATGGTICIGNSIMVTASGANAYTWSTGPFTSSILVNPIANTQYCVTGVDLNGCKNSTCTSVAVNAKPIITASANPNFICNGESATITVTGGNTYTWVPGSFNGSVVVVTPNTTITYTVTGTDGNGCTNFDTTVIIVNPPISAGISGTDETCGNKAGKVCASPNGGTPGYTYVWNVAGDSLCLDSLHAGTFTVTVTDSKGCTTIKTVSISNQIINPSGIPSADKYFDVITHTFLFDWNGNYGYTYDWDFGDTTAHSNLKNPIHTYKHKGVYTVVLIVTSPDGCVSEYTFTIEVVIPTKLEVFNVFTPDNDGFNDKYRVKYEGDFLYFRMIIFNRWGNKLFETNDIDKGWDGKQWTSDGMSDGTYYYIISAKGKDMVEYEFHGYLTLIR